MDRFDSVMFIAPIMYILPMVIFWSYVGNVKLIGEKTNGI